MKTSSRRAVRINGVEWQHPGVRISNAMYLMQTTDLSVIKIAYEVGFVERYPRLVKCSEMLTFEREFKKHTLRTPKEFKDSLSPD